jgi:NADH-quinone oxidoreductase subunit L
MDPTLQLAPGVMGIVPWVVLIPLIGLLVNLLVGKWLGEKGVGAVASLAAGGAFVIAVLLALELGGMAKPEGVTPEATGVVVPFMEWIKTGSLSVGWDFRVDTLSVTMMLVVAAVGTLIHVYAIGYMHSDVRHNGDPGRFRRFFIYLNLFIVAMMILVSADNYLMMFVGWEGVGLCSYLLIGFWFEKGADGIGNARAAKKAMLANRIGDFGLLIALFLMFGAFGTFEFQAVFEKVKDVAPWVLTAITLFMLLGVTGKSAQLPLFVWLPDAMAGPTPVSALIHAATMVTAGVYLIARSSALYMAAPVAQSVVTWVGALTALFAATIAVGQNDIKKVLAYSTISQLGFMVAAVGMGAFVAGMFHLVTHAFFKALLFLGAGSVILGMEHGEEHAHGKDHHGHAEDGGDPRPDGGDPQDMRNMGGLRDKMPVTFWVYLIGALALAGVAPLAGFFSKDEILAAASQQNLPVFVVLIIAAFFTAFYVGRQLLLVFWGKGRSPAAEHAQESPAVVTLPLVVLAVLTVFAGGLNFPGSHLLESWLEHTLGPGKPGEFLVPVALGSLGVSLLGLVLAWGIYSRRKTLAKAGGPDPLKRILGPIYTGMEHKWWVDELYHALVIGPYEALCRFLAVAVDQELVDGIVNGFGELVAWFAGVWRKLQSGYVRSYALTILLGVVAILTYLAFVSR